VARKRLKGVVWKVEKIVGMTPEKKHGVGEGKGKSS